MTNEKRGLAKKFYCPVALAKTIFVALNLKTLNLAPSQVKCYLVPITSQHLAYVVFLLSDNFILICRPAVGFRDTHNVSLDILYDPAFVNSMYLLYTNYLK